MKITDQFVVLAASFFHDLISYPKNSAKRSLSSKHSAIKAKGILLDFNYYPEKLDNIVHSIEAHSFSANITPLTHEAKIVQDADRMEALGAIGLARLFYIAGQMKSKLFSNKDPFAENRMLNDKKFAVDHFYTKLFTLPNTMQTEKGKIEAERRANVLKRYLEDLKLEIY